LQKSHALIYTIIDEIEKVVIGMYDFLTRIKEQFNADLIDEVGRLYHAVK